ncbi:Sel1-repeat-containing protein YbeT [Durusdinium trenchii]|uniref:Sel1-repeat-containing protein YbeT n=1 Tax=Durusdinium trenchii TaxID=1381693 RepID=A0ABP0JGD4_9DINO
MINGTWSDEELGKLLQPMVQELILPYVRSRYSCEECTVAEILVRRYLSEERRTHNLHFDGHAYATVVLGLTPPDEYEGGLYIQPTPHSNSRRFVQLEPGDLFVHSFDLQHGVRLWSGSRYSLIFWIKSSPAAVATGTTPWYHRSAAEGDPDAMYNLAGQFLQGIEGEVDVMEALRLYEKAAKMGHYGARQFTMNRLVDFILLLLVVCMRLNRTAPSSLGQALRKSLAFAYANGQGLSQDLAKAAHWMLQAAEQDDLEAAYVLSSMYRHGQGFPTNNLEADRWLRASAEANYADAMREWPGTNGHW